MNKKQTLNEESSRIKQIMGLNEGEVYKSGMEELRDYEIELQTVPGVIKYLNRVSQKIEFITKDLEKIYGETSYWHYIEPIYNSLKSVSDMEGFYTSTDSRAQNIKNAIDRIDTESNEDLSRYDDEQDMPGFEGTMDDLNNLSIR